MTPGSGSNTVAVAGENNAFETVEEYLVVIDENFAGGSDESEVQQTKSAGDDE